VISDYGLGFLFDMMKDLVINQDFISILYRVVAKIVKTKLRESFLVPSLPEPPAEGEEVNEEERAAAQKKIEESLRANQEIERFNDEVMKLQAKVRVAVRPSVTDVGGVPEVALMKISNYREPKPEDNSPDPVRSASDFKTGAARESALSELDAGLENFQLEDIPTKMILIDQKVSEDTHLIAYH
jgi:hypothetical protein